MGCGPSKTQVEKIVIEDGKVKSAGKTRQIKVEPVALETKSTSAKSRDSGIGEMDIPEDDGIITEHSDPNLIHKIVNDQRPETPDLGIHGLGMDGSATTERFRSKVILQELEEQGLISGPRINKGGAAFEVNTGPLRRLEPLAPLKLPPPRLQSAKQRRPLTKKELEVKLKLAEERRMNTLSAKKTSRVANNLAKATSMANAFQDSAYEESMEQNEIDEILLTETPRNIKPALNHTTWQTEIENNLPGKEANTVI